MANFIDALDELLADEGGRTEDHAGPTNFGITLLSLDEDLNEDGEIDAKDIWCVDRAYAEKFYHRWWKKYGYDRIMAPVIATKMLNLSPLMGPYWAHLCIQRALRAAGRPVGEDGIFGPVTVEAVNEIPPQVLIAAFRSEAAGRFRMLAMLDKKKYAWALNGWLAKRAYD